MPYQSNNLKLITFLDPGWLDDPTLPPRGLVPRRHLWWARSVLEIVFVRRCVYAALVVSVACAGSARHSVTCMCSVCPLWFSRCVIIDTVIMCAVVIVLQH